MRIPRAVWILLILGVALRLPFFPLVGSEADFYYFGCWTIFSLEEGVVAIYDDPQNRLPNGFINIPPVYLYMLTALGRAYVTLASPLISSVLFLLVLKTWTLIAEIATALLLFYWASKRWGENSGVWAFCLYLLNPGVIYVSAYYGQIDAIYAAFLLLAAILLVEGRYFAGGVGLALAFWTKIQAAPFLPLLLAIPILNRRQDGAFMAAGGWLAASLLILAPYWLTGRLHAVIEHSIFFNEGLRANLSQGAFNLWFLHADPSLLDRRVWGWLFDSTGRLLTNAILDLLTYRNLGMALFGAVYVLVLSQLYLRRSRDDYFSVISQITLLIFMTPTAMRETAMLPFFAMYALLASSDPVRRGWYGIFALAFLLNLMTVHPLFGAPPALDELHTSWSAILSAMNLALVILFLFWETRSLTTAGSTVWMTRAVLVSLFAVSALLLARSAAQSSNPNILYLSHIQPIYSRQDWPPIPPELPDPPPGWQIGMDVSTEGEPIRIGNTLYRFGLGAHANSIIEYDVPPGYTVFETWVGVDRTALPDFTAKPVYGTVRFTVKINGELAYESPVMNPAMPARRVSLPLPSGRVNRLTLEVHDGGDGIDADHADWALARVIRPVPGQ